MNETPQKPPIEDSLLIELDALFKRYEQVAHVATWGGSFEREHGARMELKPVVNKMFDTLLALLKRRASRASRPKAADSVPELLEALREIDSMLKGDMPITSQVKEIAQAAIKKSEGTI